MKKNLFLNNFQAILLIALSVAILNPVSTNAQVISTVVGNGTGTFSGDGIATANSIYRPTTSVVDAAGNIYIADWGNHRIRKVTSSGIMTTIAGTGTMGHTGDGGPATAATLNKPNGLTLDASGNIYCAEQGHVVRKISTTGIITTVAGTGSAGFTGDGGAATSATMNTTSGVAIDASGNIYIADFNNNVVRKVSGSTGIITTIAGSSTGLSGSTGDGGPGTAAMLYRPWDLSLDPTANNLYISDQYNNKIRVLNLSTGIISLVAGTGTSSTVFDGIPATAANLNRPTGVLVSGGNVYIGGLGNEMIFRVNLTTGLINIIAGTGAGGFSGDGGLAATCTMFNPSGVSTDAVGNLYVCDFNNHRVRKLGTSVTGASFICEGSSTTLTGFPSGGIWSSSNTSTATVGSSSGIVTGVAAGIVTISYTTSAGTTAAAITVNPTPVVTCGATSLCVGTSAAICSTSTPGATWTITPATVATVSPTTGIVTGISPGVFTPVCWLGSCSVSVSATVNPTPTAIIGSSSVCENSTTPLTNSTFGGTWSASNGNATVNSSSGIVSGVAVGTVTISYTLSTGCYTTKNLTVNPAPGPITGLSNVCEGSTYIGYCTGAGYWSSGGPACMTVGSASGIVTAITACTGTICNTNSFGCSRCITVTVNPIPTAFTVTGGGSYCAGAAGLHVGLGLSSVGFNYELYRGGVATGITLVGTGSALDFGLQTMAGTYTVMATNAATGCYRLMSGSVTITITPLPTLICGPSALCVGGSIAPCTPSPSGGTWTSSNTSVASVGSSSGIVGGVAAGTATITYTSTGGCYATSGITVTTSPCPLSLTGVCVGGVTTFTNCISGGLWTSSNPSVANIGSLSGNVTGMGSGTATISYSLGSSSCTVTGTMSVTSSIAPITGPTFACVGATSSLSHTTPGGTWSSSNTSIATVGTTGIVTGVSTGIVTITYSVTGCTTTKTITVNATPATIVGPSSTCNIPVCVTETNSVSGGTWSSSSAAIATIGSSTGVLCPVSAGTATITYSIGGCYVTKPVTVLAAPAPITGPGLVCTGATATLINSVSGGTWTSTLPTIAAVGSTGIVSGMSMGSTTISYTLSSGCYAVRTMTVLSSPAAITGATNICTGDCVGYIDPTPSGTWSCSPTTVGTIDAITGIYCGISAGAATVTYTLSGCVTTHPVSVSLGPAPITGTTNVCVGSTTTLSNTTPGGTWASSDIARATVGSGSGIVTGVSMGTIIISYTIGSCLPAITAVIINDVMPISGTPVVCVGQTTYLTNASLIGSWSSSNIGIATITPSGLVRGIAPGTATISYTMPTGCVATMAVTVQPSPAALTGPSMVCVGQTITLGPGTLSGGTWSSSSADVSVSSVGVVTGVTVGYATISYVHSATGCFSTKAITVNGAPPAITGADDICVGTCATYTHPLAGGVWSTASSVAAVGSSSGIVCAGASAGTAVITYIAPGSGCPATKSANIVLPPAVITGPSGICAYSSATLTSTTTGGVWTSSNPVVATVGLVSGIVTGNVPGITTISYTLGCSTTKTITVNVAPPPITGVTNICTGITTHLSNPLVGGRWYSSDTTIATVDSMTGIVTGRIPGAAVITYGLSNGCSSAVTVIVSPGIAPITGTNRVCVGTSTLLSDASPGGVWSSSNPSVAIVTGSGFVTGVILGTTTISYVVSGICPVTMVVTVNPNPGPITGTTVVCAGSSTTLSNPVIGGVWSSGSLGLATVNPASGAVTGVAAGIADITYTMGVGCEVSTYVTVNPLPSPISGTNNICALGTFTLTDATPGGVWSSSAPSIASISSAGTVTGSSAGTALISYAISTGCAATHPVTINPIPAPISGSSAVCLSGTTTLSDAVTGGTWTSSAPGIMTVGSSSGIVSGVSLSSATITYQLPAGCYTTKTLSVSPLPTLFTVVGGGSYCGGGAGVHIGISSSVTGVNYMLHLGATAVGAFPGTGGSIDFGLHTLTGTYTVTGTSTSTTCSVTMTGSVSVSITPFVTPAVSFRTVPSDTICSGATVIFTPIPVNSGTAPTYLWSVNGTTVSAAATYSFIPADGDVVKVKMTSNAMCPLPDSAIYQDTMSVIPFGAPTVNLVAVPNDTVCQGTAVTVNAITIFGGSAPYYRWIHNGILVGGTPSYTFVPNDNDEVFCILNSNYPCRYTSIDTSEKVNFTVDTPKLPSLFIAATPGTTIELGQTDTLYVVTDAVDPTYQWYINGIPVPGATTNTYISSSFNYPDPDSVSCQVTSNGVCVVSAHTWTHITVIQIDHTGIGTMSKNNDITILPNPNKGIFTIQGHIGSMNDHEISLEITNMLGQVVYTTTVITTDGKINEQVRLPGHLANGMYMLILRSGTNNRIFNIQVNQ